MTPARLPAPQPSLAGWCLLLLTGLAPASMTVWADPVQPQPRSAEEVFELSMQAYRRAPALEDTLTLSVDFPGQEPGTRVIRYALGQGPGASFEIEGLLRIDSVGDRVYVTRPGVDDRYLETPFDGDLRAALASVRGRSRAAGFWEPPQVALRAGKNLDAVLDALRLTPDLEKLEIVGYQRLPDARHEVRLAAANGGCTVRWDPSSLLLESVDYVIRPSGAPEGYELRMRGRYSPRVLDPSEVVSGFDPGGRLAVSALNDLAAPAPERAQLPSAVLPEELLSSRMIGMEKLADAVRDRRVLLIGEAHLFNETLAYASALLEKLDDRPVSLLIELPAGGQPLIDRFVDEGDELALESLFSGRGVLPCQALLRWARAHRERVLRVRAIDEDLFQIRMKRTFASDTRNRTMARAILEEYEDNPGARVVAYCGQLHMTMAGRYRFDEPSREPAGSRLLGLGVPRGEIASIMLSGGEEFPLHAAWKQPGVLPMTNELAQIPFPHFIDYPVFGVTGAGELFDYFVNLGPLTRVELPPQ